MGKEMQKYLVRLPDTSVAGIAIGGLELISAPNARCATSKALSRKLGKSTGLGMHILDQNGGAQKYSKPLDVEIESTIFQDVPTKKALRKSDPQYHHAQAVFLASDIAEIVGGTEQQYFGPAKRYLSRHSRTSA